MATKAKAKKEKASTAEAAIATHQRICNLLPSKGTERDWQYGDAVSSSAITAVAAPPAAIDLRQPWWTVGNQLNTGSCVGWAAAEGVVRYHMVKAGKLNTTTRLSPRFVWMASKETDPNTARPETFIEEAGTYLKTAMDVCRNYGVVPDGTLSFLINTLMYTGAENSFYALAAQRKIAAYFNLQKNLASWKSWLASHGPILVGLSVDRTWDNATATHGNLDAFQPNTVRGGHAVAVVGYTAAGRFIIRNSWGTAWGDGGFAYASPAYIAAAFFNESYGVTV